MLESAAPEYLLVLTAFDEDHVTPEVSHLSAARIAACPSLAQLREEFGGDRGALTDPAGNEHFVVLSGPPRLHPSTRFLVAYHVVSAVTSGRD